MGIPETLPREEALNEEPKQIIVDDKQSGEAKEIENVMMEGTSKTHDSQ